MGTLVTLGELDHETQARATEVFNELCGVYGLAPALFRADEVGTAARDAANSLGSADAGFKGRMWDLLLFRVHLKMGQHAERGEHLPCTLGARNYALLRRALEQRFGKLPDDAPEPAASDEEQAGGEAEDTRSDGEKFAEILAARRSS
ncbi:MAG: hypothetical protein ABI193_22965 [Minicystis sp.]